MASNRRARRAQERRGRAARLRAKASTTPGRLWARLSTDWIAGGIIGGVILIAALVFLFAQVFRSGGGDTSEITQVFSLAVSPTDPDTIFLGDVTGLFRSADGGQQWDRFGISEPVRSVYSDPNDPNSFFAAGGNTIWKSVDGGLTWPAIRTDLPTGSISALASDPLDSSKIYAFVSASGLLKSEDGGASWTVQDEITGAGVTSLAVKPGSPDVVYGFHTVDGFFIGTDNGKRIRPIGEPEETGLPTRGVSDILTIAGEPNTVFAVAGRSVYKSVDSGRNWQPSAGGLEGTQALALARHPATGDFYLVDFIGGIRVSHDDGASWVLPVIG